MIATDCPGLRKVCARAGGYGDPRQRDRALVRRDLGEGTISPEVARDVYGLSE